MEILVLNSIAELLHVHDCVVLPGFGGFVSRKISAYISPGNNTIYPSSKSVIFNKNLTHNDGLLANHLNQRFGFSYHESNQIIEKFVQELNSNLYKNQRFELEKIGTFYLNLEKNIQFEPNSNLNFLPDSFGLHPITLRKLEVEKTISNKEDRKQILSEEKKKFSTKGFKTVAAVGSICLILGFMAAVSVAPKNSFLATINPFQKSYPPKYETKKFSSNLEFNSDKVIEDIEPISIKKVENDKIVFVYVEKPSNETNELKSVKSEILSKNNPYNALPNAKDFEIIIGCFREKGNAERMTSNAKRENFSSKIIGKNEKELFVVSAGGFSNLDSAVSSLLEVRKKYPDAWVLKK